MEQQVPVKLILLNNNYLGNYMQIAAAYGIAGRRVMERDELEGAIREMLDTDGPFLLEVCVVEEGNVLPMTPPGSSVNDMLLELDC